MLRDILCHLRNIDKIWFRRNQWPVNMSQFRGDNNLGNYDYILRVPYCTHCLLHRGIKWFFISNVLFDAQLIHTIWSIKRYGNYLFISCCLNSVPTISRILINYIFLLGFSLFDSEKISKLILEYKIKECSVHKYRGDDKHHVSFFITTNKTSQWCFLSQTTLRDILWKRNKIFFIWHNTL